MGSRSAPSPLRTPRGLDRLINFSDAMVAIAITLLLLPLVDVAAEIEDESVGELLGQNASTLAAFAFTFAVIARLWISHHRLFEAAVGYNYRIVWMNFLWLASIAFMPFAANVLAHSDSGNAGVNALYIGTVLVSSGSLLGVDALLLRSPDLLAENARAGLHIADAVMSTAAILLALVLSVLVPQVGMFWLLLLIVPEVVERVRRGSSR